jgi:hypothetical protein
MDNNGRYGQGMDGYGQGVDNNGQNPSEKNKSQQSVVVHALSMSSMAVHFPNGTYSRQILNR